jgi:hypothetical protein
MRFQARIPRFATSTVEAGPERPKPILNGTDHTLPNRWKIPANTVAMIGRPAVWTALDITIPSIPLGFTSTPAIRHRWEQDFGGHLFLAIAGADPTRVTIVEGGPLYPGGKGALVPFCYAEDDYAKRGIVDFDPIVIPPPHGLRESFFAELVCATQHSYDGDQLYRAIEIPFLRVGRDSNSYAIGILLACGVDPRSIPKPHNAVRFEWIGYPGAEDPAHRANFGAYLGAPSPAPGGTVDVAYHNEDGSVRLVLVGGEPNARAVLPDGTEVVLDRFGRMAFSPEDARAHGLPSNQTKPPSQIRNRRHFPPDPAPAGAEITLIVNGESQPLRPGDEYRGTIVERHESIAVATLRTATGDIVLPLLELGVELRDPKRVDTLLRVGNELTVGLHADRNPKLIAHGDAALEDSLEPHRAHVPRPAAVATFVAAALAAVFAAFLWWRVSREQQG